jgi:hypothetical protein
MRHFTLTFLQHQAEKLEQVHEDLERSLKDRWEGQVGPKALQEALESLTDVQAAVTRTMAAAHDQLEKEGLEMSA